MLVYAGIDEAGYGPILGPLVIARTVFLLDRVDPLLAPPSLWTALKTAVCRRAGDRQGRIAVNDSKALYNPALGLSHLERGVLTFLGLTDCQPLRLEELLEQISFDELSCRLDHPCYLNAYGGPELPRQAEPNELEKARGRLRRAADRAGIRLAGVSAAVLLEDRFNRELAVAGNKALAAWTYVAGHLQAIWEEYGEAQPQVVIDRQGGRIYYLELLASLFPQARLCVLQESAPVSRYQLIQGSRRMVVTVQVESERWHLPAALASMTAKYLRELLLTRFQAFWLQHAPEVRPTCGYFRDGRRFLREVEPMFAKLNLDRGRLVRAR